MRADIKRILIHAAVLLSGSVLAGTLLLVLVFCIPTDRMREHASSFVTYVLDGESHLPDAGFFRRMRLHIAQDRESYTDSIMVQYTFEKVPGKNAFEHAMWAWHYDMEEEIWAAEESLRAVLSGADTSGMHLREYSRYWHGYLVYLKPLLWLMRGDVLLWVELALQLALTVWVAILCVRKRCAGLIAAMAAGLLFMKPELMAVSLTMSVCSVITLAALLFLLLRGDWLREKGYHPEFFFCIGIMTAYFDFLTYPVVTLGFPLCAYFLTAGEERIWNSLQKIAGYACCWGAGYVGMWASKWVIADLTLRTGTIRDAVWNVLGRTETIGGRPRMNGGFYVISLNLQEYGSSIYTWLAAALVLAAALSVAWALIRGVPFRAVCERVFPFLIAGLIPFAWIVVVQHHSALHARFTFRILGVAAMALGCICVQMFRLSRKSPENGKKPEKTTEKKL